MSDVFCVTARSLCHEDFLSRVEKIAAAHPAGIILREKDLAEKDYEDLAQKVLSICQGQNTLCILHNFVNVARKLNCPAVHLPLPVLRTLSEEEKTDFAILGASCHSVEDALEAQRLGCTYITAGHVFDTDCKRGLPGRGLEFLQAVCSSVAIPVYAIGGISPESAKEVRSTGASGVCVMSSAMTCDEPEKYFEAFNA